MQPQFPAHAVVVRDPTDVMGRRIAALAIDWAIAIAVAVALALTLASTEELPTARQAEARCKAFNEEGRGLCIPLDDTIFMYDGGDIATILLLPLLYHFLADAILTGLTGFSIGKGLVGLRVISQSTGQLCGMGRAMLRWLLWAADAAPYCFPVVALATGLSSKGHRRVGDMAANTLVVDRRDVGTVPVVPGLTVMAAPPWAPSNWGVPPPGPPPPDVSSAGPYPPQAPPYVPPAPVTQPAVNPGVDAPIWDDARDAYIQWDAEIGAWVQWDDATKQWRPIS